MESVDLGGGGGGSWGRSAHHGCRRHRSLSVGGGGDDDEGIRQGHAAIDAGAAKRGRQSVKNESLSPWCKLHIAEIEELGEIRICCDGDCKP